MTAADFSDDKALIWLASYPKSGNTWLRSLLTAYLFDEEDFDLNAMIGEQNPFDRQVLDDHAGISSVDYLSDELIAYQAQLHRDMARAEAHYRLIKTHSAYVRSNAGMPLFPASASAGAILVVRNPFDIVPSYAHHEAKGFDWIIKHMRDEAAGTDNWPGRANTAIPQIMASWSSNVSSWFTQTQIPVHLLRYEDMHRDPEASLTSVLRFCAIDVDQTLVSRAVNRCSFERLKADEQAGGFSERPSTQRSFFRSGTVGDGRQNLTETQIRGLLVDHGAVMETVGYSTALDEHLAKSAAN